MELKKFFGAEDAARYAAEITDEWETEDGDLWDKGTLIDVANCADGENPLDEDDDEVYYIVDESGAVGYTEDDGEDVCWWVRPTGAAEPRTAFCPNCGTAVDEDWSFCQKCGQRLQ